MSVHLFQGAASKWGTGKVHFGVYNAQLGRMAASCQRLDPLKGGHDAYDGYSFEGEQDEVDCKRCLVKAEEARWAPVVEQVRQALMVMHGIRPGSRQAEWAYSNAAKNTVQDYAAKGGVPGRISASEIVDHHYDTRWNL